jgi:hypothetical protein
MVIEMVIVMVMMMVVVMMVTIMAMITVLNAMECINYLLLLKNKQLEQISGRVMKSMKMLPETQPGDTQSKMRNLLNNDTICSLIFISVTYESMNHRILHLN